MDASVPIIDFSSWTNNDQAARLETAKSLVQACHEAGFAYIKNHGIPTSLIDSAFSQSHAFHSLSTDERMKVKVREGAVRTGYSRPGLEKASRMYTHRDGKNAPEDIMKMNEVFMITDENTRIDNEPANLFLPEEVLPGFRETITKFYAEMWLVGSKILQALALGMGLAENALLEHHTADNHMLAFRHYPTLDIEKAKAQGMPRMSPHRDFTPSVTMLFQDSVGGLEVAASPKDDKTLVPVEPIEGTFVLNIGDVLQRWSNDYLRSTLHGVALPPKESPTSKFTLERYSIPFFVHPKQDLKIECLPSCMDEKNPPKYEPISYKEHVQAGIKRIFETTEKL